MLLPISLTRLLSISPPWSLPPGRHISQASGHVGILLLIPGWLLPRELATGSWLCRCPYHYRGLYPYRHRFRYLLEDILAILAAM